MKIVRILGFNCGQKCLHKFNVMGIKIGDKIEILTKQPFNGPVVIKHKQTKLVIGKGMFDKIKYEVIE